MNKCVKHGYMSVVNGRCTVCLEEELETWRMKLAACGVAALSNTDATVVERLSKENPYYSESYADVCKAVDREMKLRDELQRLRLKKSRLRRELRRLNAAQGVLWRVIHLQAEKFLSAVSTKKV